MLRMLRKTVWIAVVLMSVSVLFCGNVNAAQPNYTYEITLVDNSILDASSAGLLGKPEWYQWIYKVEVVPGGDLHNGLSHFTLDMLDCYDRTLLAAILPTAGANSGNLYGLSGDEVRPYSITVEDDGSTDTKGVIKWDSAGLPQLDAIGEYDYFWFSAPTQESEEGTGVAKFGSTFITQTLDVPNCPECDEPVVPEPASMLLLGSGLMGAFIRKRHRA